MAELNEARSNVHTIDNLIHAPAGQAETGRRLQNDRHVDSGVVNEESVLLFTVLAQTFAVVTREENQAGRINVVDFKVCD